MKKDIWLMANKKPDTSCGRYRNLLLKGLPDITLASDQFLPLNQRIHNFS